MRLTMLTLVFSFAISFSHGQVKNPVKWTFQVEKIDNANAVLTATADIDEGWFVYSQHTDPEGPVPTSFDFGISELVGKTVEKSEAITKFSDLFEVEVVKFKDKAVFEQKIKIKEGQKNIAGSATFMCCNNNRCLPPTTASFSIDL